MKKKLPIIIVALMLITFGVWSFVRLLQPIDPNTDFMAESLRWTKIGAIGSWAGSVFAAVALIISILAFWLPQRVKIHASITSGFGMSYTPREKSIDVWIITVKNIGIKSVTINNIYLNFGKNNGDVFVGSISDGTPFKTYMPDFPVRLDQGESFNFYMPVSNLREGLQSIFENISPNAKMRIGVDEVIGGKQYFKTDCTLGTFIRG